MSDEKILKVLEEISLTLRKIQLSQQEILTSKEACIFINRSIQALYKLTASGKIPHSNPKGKTLYFNRVDLEEWKRNESLLDRSKK